MLLEASACSSFLVILSLTHIRVQVVVGFNRVRPNLYGSNFSGEYECNLEKGEPVRLAASLGHLRCLQILASFGANMYAIYQHLPMACTSKPGKKHAAFRHTKSQSVKEHTSDA